MYLLLTTGLAEFGAITYRMAADMTSQEVPELKNAWLLHYIFTPKVLRPKALTLKNNSGAWQTLSLTLQPSLHLRP